jgi:hypothetical protein
MKHDVLHSLSRRNRHPTARAADRALTVQLSHVAVPRCGQIVGAGVDVFHDEAALLIRIHGHHAGTGAISADGHSRARLIGSLVPARTTMPSMVAFAGGL